MAFAQAQIYAAPFDAIAERYDETFTRSKIGRAQRASVWKELERVFRPGDRVLEIGCGNGAVLGAITQPRSWERLVGSELHPSGLANARSRLSSKASVTCCLPGTST